MTNETCKHIWWHADDVHHNVVCLLCGAALLNTDVRKVTHHTTPHQEMIVCGNWYHERHYQWDCNSGNEASH